MAGRTIVLTVANGGLGGELSEMYAYADDTVFMLGSLDKLTVVAETISGPTHVAACDVNDPESIDFAFAAIRNVTDRIHVLISNAAVFGPLDFASVTNQQVAASVMANLAGPIRCSRNALPFMQPGGQTINLSPA